VVAGVSLEVSEVMRDPVGGEGDNGAKEMVLVLGRGCAVCAWSSAHVVLSSS
jgi:hypothetical protein